MLQHTGYLQYHAYTAAAVIGARYRGAAPLAGLVHVAPRTGVPMCAYQYTARRGGIVTRHHIGQAKHLSCMGLSGKRLLHDSICAIAPECAGDVVKASCMPHRSRHTRAHLHLGCDMHICTVPIKDGNLLIIIDTRKSFLFCLVPAATCCQGNRET